MGGVAAYRALELRGMAEVYHQPGGYLPFLPSLRRWILFVSTASIAASFLSMCGSLRGPPECSKQRFPEPTLHV
jgi:hypothetical protein